jgi:tRNA-splicing endonuclease subunit Sen15, fungi type
MATTVEVPSLGSQEDILSVSQNHEHPTPLHHLAATILHNLQYQHDWTSLSIHTYSTLTGHPLPRPVISGLPPIRAYIHPDEQIEVLKAEHETGKPVEQFPELEWVLPSHWEEKWTLARFAAVFDALDVVPPTGEDAHKQQENAVGHEWRGRNRQKRLLLATLHDDSTVVYYIMHDGIVKPRQN